MLFALTTLLVQGTSPGRANVEGPRRTVLFFSVDYGLRFAFALLVGRQLPGDDVVGLMGFGYLLPTLLAVKIAQKGAAPLVLLPAAKVSLAVRRSARGRCSASRRRSWTTSRGRAPR